MVMSLENLKKGLDWWCRRRGWPTDFLNADYYQIYADRSHGVTNEWWAATVNRLTRWGAIRGGKPAPSKPCITRRGMRALDEVRKEFSQIMAKAEGEPSIETVSWQDIDSLFSVAGEIKPRSGVFASKMCHLLLLSGVAQNQPLRGT